MRLFDRIVARAGLLVVALVAIAGVALLAAGLFDQWLRYRDFLAQGIGFTDRACALPFCDFALFWEAGRLAAHGQAGILYDNARYFAAVGQAMAPHTDKLPFMYAPVTTLLTVPMSLPALAAGYYAFTAFSLAAGVLLLARAGVPFACILIGLISVPAMWNFYLGQFGLLSGGLLICGLMLLETRPYTGGALLALLVIKPQYALLAPVVVLASRNFRALLGGAGTLLCLVALSILCFGWPAWAGFLGPGQATMRAFLEAPFQPGYETLGASVFWMARSFGSSVGAAYAAQGLALSMAGAAAWRLWLPGKNIDPASRMATTVCLVLLADPHAYTDDMVGYSVILPMLARRETPVTNALLALLWLAPALAAHFTRQFGFLPLPFCVAAAAAIAWRRCAESAPAPAFRRDMAPAATLRA